MYWGMTLGASELLANGVTTTCEQYRHPAPVVEAVLDAGIRAMYTPAIFDVPDAGPGSSWEALLGRLLRDRRRDGRQGRPPRDGLRAACRLHGAARRTAGDRDRSPSPRRAVADPSLRDHGRVHRRTRALRHERAGAAGRRGGARGPRPGGARGVARRDRHGVAGRTRCRGRALPRLQRQARFGDRSLAGAARAWRAGRPRHRRPGVQRRSAPVGRAPPGAAPGAGRGRGPRGRQLRNGTTTGHPRRCRGAGAPRRCARGRAAGGRHPVADR